MADSLAITGIDLIPELLFEDPCWMGERICLSNCTTSRHSPWGALADS
jgi:hypothetical protein